MTKTIKTLAKVTSYLFHPIFMPTIGVILISYSNIYTFIIPPETTRAILLLVALSTILFPLSIFGLLYFQQKITKITMPSRQERLLPLFISVIFYYATYYMLKRLYAPLFIQQFMFVAFICLTITFAIHFKWKISMHMMAFGGLTGLWTAMSYIFYLTSPSIILSALILLAGLTGSSRLVLQAHTQRQIHIGFLLGYIISFGTLVLLN